MNATILIQNNGGELRLPFNEDVFRAVQALLKPMQDPVTDTSLVTSPAGLKTPQVAPLPQKPLRQPLRHLHRTTPSERRAAVSFYVQSNLTVPAAARELGVPNSTLDHWVREALGTADRRRMCPAAIQRWIAS